MSHVADTDVVTVAMPRGSVNATGTATGITPRDSSPDWADSGGRDGAAVADGGTMCTTQPLLWLLILAALLGVACIVFGNTLPAQPTLAQRLATSICGAAVILLALFELWRRWCVAQPNQWMLVLESGRLRRAGIGMRVFRGFSQTVATMPSTLQKVPFGASQVTKEMQGVDLQGFVAWTVYRRGDGPLRAFKYLQGMTPEGLSLANTSVKDMAESIVRHNVANLGILQVIASRDVVRDRVRTEMQQVLTGWGLWLETVEVTEVKICSHSLFEDLQADCRAKVKIEAERVRKTTQKQLEQEEIACTLEIEKRRADAKAEQQLYTAQKDLERERQLHQLVQEQEKLRVEAELVRRRGAAQLQQEKLEEEMRIAKRRAEIAMEQTVHAAQQELAQQTETEKVNQEKHRIAVQEAVRRRELQIAEATMTAEVELVRSKSASERQWLSNQQELNRLKSKLEIEGAASAASMQLQALETLRDVYQHLPLQNVSLTQFGSTGDARLDTLIPGLSAFLSHLLHPSGSSPAPSAESRK